MGLRAALVVAAFAVPAGLAAAPPSASEVGHRLPATAGVEAVAGARTPEAPSGLAPAPGGTWTWPLPGRPVVARRFEPPPARWAAGHRGVDLMAPVGTPVRAPAAGTVSFAGLVAGRHVLVVAHAGGLRSTLEPVSTRTPTGSAVAGGDVVGALDAAAGHCSPERCLHWGVLRGAEYLDPLGLLHASVVLLPLR